MPERDSNIVWSDWLAAIGLGIFFLVLYLVFHQGTLLFNGAAFIAWFEPRAFFLSHHPAFGYFMHAWIRAMDWLGVRPVNAGLAQSALAMSLCVGLFYRFLRGFNLEWPIAMVVAFLLGWNGSSFNAATTVETYAISFLTVMINLFAFKRVIERPSLRSDVLLLLSCLLVLAFHLGWCFWVLALYLTLAWNDRARPWRAIGRLAEGGGVALIMAAVWFAFRLVQSDALVEEQKYFSTFWYGSTGLGIAIKLIKKPFFDFACLAGFILFGAGLGLFGGERHHSPWKVLLCVASVIFFGYYSFWPADHGCYYLPLQPLWGLSTAFGIQLLARSRHGLIWPVLALLLAFGALLVLSQQNGPQRAWLALGFWAILGLQVVCGFGLGWFSGRSGNRDSAVPIRSTSAGLVCAVAMGFLVLAVVGGTVAYGPQVLRDHRPSSSRLLLEAFRVHASEDARLVSWIEPPHMPYAITMHPTASGRAGIFFKPEENQANREKLDRWLKEAAEGSGPVLIFDEYSHQMLDDIWSRPEAPSTALSALTFVPVDFGDFRFYRVEPSAGG